MSNNQCQNQLNSMLMMAQMYAALQILQSQSFPQQPFQQPQQMPIPMNSSMNNISPQWINNQQIPYQFGSEKKIIPKVNNQTSKVLLEWFNAHISNPYPEPEERQLLREKTGFNDTQIGDWFRNRRRNIKKANYGIVPWKEPATGRKRRRADSIISNLADDSNTSSDSMSSLPTSNPILSALLSSKPNMTGTNSSNHNHLLTVSLNDQNISCNNNADISKDDSGFIDVITVDENCSSNSSSKVSKNDIKDEETSGTPPSEKRQKLWSVNDIIIE